MENNANVNLNFEVCTTVYDVITRTRVASSRTFRLYGQTSTAEGTSCPGKRHPRSTCGFIHNESDALAIAEALATPLSRFSNVHHSNARTRIYKARTRASLLEQKLNTSHSRFTPTALPVMLYMAVAARELLARCIALLDGVTEHDLPDITAPYTARGLRGFRNFLKDRWIILRRQKGWVEAYPFPCNRINWAFLPEAPTVPTAPPSRTPSSSSQGGQSRRRPTTGPPPPDPHRTQGSRSSSQDRNERSARRDSREQQRQQQQQERERAQAEQQRQQDRQGADSSRRDRDHARQGRTRAEEQAERERAEQEARDKAAEENENTRQVRDAEARALHETDAARQRILFLERESRPHVPATRPESVPTIRSVNLPSRLPPFELAAREALRTEEIAEAKAAAAEALAEATTPQERVFAQTMMDKANSNSRRFPAYPFNPSSTFDPTNRLAAMDRLHPHQYAITFVHINRFQSDFATRRLAEVIGAQLEKYEQVHATDPIERDRVLKFVFAAPTLFLRVPRVKNDSPERRFDLYERGSLDQLIMEFIDDAEKAEDAARAGSSPSHPDILARVLYLLSQGEISKAVSATTPNAINDLSNPLVMEQLIARVGKKRSEEIVGNLNDNGIPYPRVKFDVGKAYRALERHKGTGPDNVPAEILSRIARKFNNNANASAAVKLHQIIADQYLAGSLPHWFYAVENIAELVPLSKNASSIDVRPISMTSTPARCWQAQAAQQATKNSETHFGSVQFGAGVRGGAFTHAIAPALYLEQAEGDQSIVLMDIHNAYSELKRPRANDSLSLCTDPNIRALAPSFHAANSASLRPKGVDVVIEEGGGQGSPLMSVVFAQTYLEPLLKLKAKVTGAGAYQDDTWTAGSLRSTLPAILEFADDIKEIGLELNLAKCKIIPKDANAVRATLTELTALDPRFALFPIASMPESDPATALWGDGIGSMMGGTPVGDDKYVHYETDRIVREAIADMEHAHNLITHSSAQGAFAVLRQSSITRINHLSMTVRPTIMSHYQKLFDDRAIACFRQISEIDFTRLPEEEQELIRLRIRAPQRSGGIGFSSTYQSARQNFINGFTMATPRIISRDLKGKWQLGCIPSLSSVLGSAFADSEKDQRYAKACSLNSIRASPICREFYFAYRSLQRSAAGADSQSAPSTGILSTPVEAAGIEDGKHNGAVLTKLASRITRELSDKVTLPRMHFLVNQIPRNKKVREATKYALAYKSTASFLGSCPSKSYILSNTDFTTAINSYLGLPIPLLRDHVGIRIPHTGSSPLLLDPHGDNLTKSTSILGNNTKRRHDGFLTVLSDMLRTAKIDHTSEDIETFSASRTDPTNPFPPLIPDLTIPRAGTRILHDLKFIGTGASIFDLGGEGIAIETRAARVNTEYVAKAASHDAANRFSRTSDTLKKSGTVRGLVVGPRGELSKDLQSLVRQAASKAAHENWRRLGKESSQLARADYLRIFTKKLAIAGIRAQASWLAGRYEQAIAQMAGAAAPDKRARDQDRRARHESEEYWSANAGFARADFRTQ